MNSSNEILKLRKKVEELDKEKQFITDFSKQIKR